MAIDMNAPPIVRYLQALALYRITVRLEGERLKFIGPKAALAEIAPDIPHLRHELVAYLKTQQEILAS